GEIEIGGKRLRNYPNRFAYALRCARHIESGAPGAAGGGHDNGSQHPRQRGLTCAVGSEQPKQLALRDFETDSIDGGERAEALNEFACLYRSGSTFHDLSAVTHPGFAASRPALFVAGATCVGPRSKLTSAVMPGITSLLDCTTRTLM